MKVKLLGKQMYDYDFNDNKGSAVRLFVSYENEGVIGQECRIEKINKKSARLYDLVANLPVNTEVDIVYGPNQGVYDIIPLKSADK